MWIFRCVLPEIRSSLACYISFPHICVRSERTSESCFSSHSIRTEIRPTMRSFERSFFAARVRSNFVCWCALSVRLNAALDSTFYCGFLRHYATENLTDCQCDRLRKTWYTSKRSKSRNRWIHFQCRLRMQCNIARLPILSVSYDRILWPLTG